MTPVKAPVRTEAIMDRIEGDVRETMRRRLVDAGGAAAYRDPAVFDAVWSSLGRAAGERNLNVLLLPELLDGIHDWDVKPQLSLSSHRRILGPIILLAKRRLLLPLSRWLLEYARENFRRQQHVNRILFACLEELAVENAQLRRRITEMMEGTVLHREAEKFPP
jgi:hypothetical protein